MNGKVNPVEARTHALSIEGVFFQQRVADMLRRAGWTLVAEEYPVAYPPGNWPNLGKEGRLDIRAERHFSGFIAVLAVECKKANPDYKEWVFFPKGRGEVRASVIRRKVRPGANEGATVRDKWEIETAVASLGEGEVCMDARELKAEHGNRDSWKTATERIEKGCYQATQATQALVAEIGRRQTLLLERQMEPTEDTWVIPVVVTTATLLVCRFDPADVSLKTGEIEWNQVSYDVDDLVALEYPLPVHLQMRPVDPLRLRSEQIGVFTKTHVFIVNGTSLDAFLQQSPLGGPLT